MSSPNEHSRNLSSVHMHQLPELYTFQLNCRNVSQEAIGYLWIMAYVMLYSASNTSGGSMLELQ